MACAGEAYLRVQHEVSAKGVSGDMLGRVQPSHTQMPSWHNEPASHLQHNVHTYKKQTLLLSAPLQAPRPFLASGWQTDPALTKGDWSSSCMECGTLCGTYTLDGPRPPPPPSGHVSMLPRLACKALGLRGGIARYRVYGPGEGPTLLANCLYGNETSLAQCQWEVFRHGGRLFWPTGHRPPILGVRCQKKQT